MGAGKCAAAQSPIDRIVASSRSHVPSDAERDYWRELIESLSARRRALGMSQATLDARLGVADHQVAKWESYQRLPGAFMMMCWASSLGVRIVAKKGEL
jgi:DNA-binding transcriptional regulator YiaG